MKLYTVTPDRRVWHNMLSYEDVERQEFTDGEVAAFRESIKDYVIKNSYRWEDDDGDGGHHVYYHEIRDGWMLISEGRVVGVILYTEHYTHSMSSCKDYRRSAVYFDRPNAKNGEIWYDSYEVYYCTTRCEDDCRIELIKRSEMPEGAKIEDRFPIPNVLN